MLLVSRQRCIRKAWGLLCRCQSLLLDFPHLDSLCNLSSQSSRSNDPAVRRLAYIVIVLKFKCFELPQCSCDHQGRADETDATAAEAVGAGAASALSPMTSRTGCDTAVQIDALCRQCLSSRPRWKARISSASSTTFPLLPWGFKLRPSKDSRHRKHNRCNAQVLYVSEAGMSWESSCSRRICCS